MHQNNTDAIIDYTMFFCNVKEKSKYIIKIYIILVTKTKYVYNRYKNARRDYCMKPVAHTRSGAVRMAGR